MLALSWVWENLKGFRKRYAFCFFLSMLMPLTALINPNFSRRLVDDVLLGGQTDLLLPLVGVMCLVTLGRTVLWYGTMGLSESVASGIVYNLRVRLYTHLQAQDMNFYNQNANGDLMTAITSDIDMVRHNVAQVWRQIASCLLLFTGATAFFFTISWKFTLVLLAVNPVIFIISRKYMKKVRGVYIDLRQKLSVLNTDAQENIEGNRVVKAFANERHAIETFNQKSAGFRDQNRKAAYAWLDFFPLIEGLAQSMTVTSLLFGGMFLMAGELTPGDYLAFTSLSWAVMDPIRQIGPLINDIQRFFASTMKLMNLCAAKPRVQNPEEPKTSDEPFRGEVEFQNVSFLFPGEGGRPGHMVLEDISFSVAPGQTVALMGETGSGKTLIAELIGRFYDVKSGRVLVDGVDVREWDLRTLRKNIGMTTQEVFLFSDSVDGNIAYGDPELSEEDVHRFAEAAAAQFIERMSEGYDTIIGERGVGLSGGQKQRIALARALAVRPRILILDDTTSAVDMETEMYIQEQLANLEFPCTKLIIAQRISSVKSADCILLLDGGKIAEQGTHEELVRCKGRYYELWRIQMGLSDQPAEEVAAHGAAQ